MGFSKLIIQDAIESPAWFSRKIPCDDKSPGLTHCLIPKIFFALKFLIRILAIVYFHRYKPRKTNKKTHLSNLRRDFESCVSFSATATLKSRVTDTVAKVNNENMLPRNAKVKLVQWDLKNYSFVFWDGFPPILSQVRNHLGHSTGDYHSSAATWSATLARVAYSFRNDTIRASKNSSLTSK